MYSNVRSLFEMLTMRSDATPDRPLPDAIAMPGLEIERLLCLGQDGALDELVVAAPDAWSLTLPSLDQFAAWPSDAPRPKICIATEQITGPVRNGGIGNTYGALAVMLATAGFDVTVLYLRGSVCETMTIGHWVDHYAEMGVTMVPVPDYAAQERLRTGADRWLHAPYNMMRWLIDHPMDVVHASEWRGSAYLCLLAKRQGLAFAQTLFLVKTSSPWMWNRLYGARMIEKAEDLAKVHAERRSVELADVVIGGSLHLLRWMASQGYALPRERVFVQPNVVTFTKLEALMVGRLEMGGTRVPIDEFVFFGRLELRKGLFVFCQTIRRLIRKGVALPPQITFMGKSGGRMPSHPDLEADDYLRLISADWPTEVKILTEYQQYDAVKYLLSGRRLAIMPSIIENSSMAVYEAAICGIPCVASDVGGNSELILPEDHHEVLCQPHPVSLGDRLEEVLAKGGYVPRPSFDNNDNLATWQRFHHQLGGALHNELIASTGPSSAIGADTMATSVCIYWTGDGSLLAATLESLAAQTVAPREVVIGIDAESVNAVIMARDLAASCSFDASVIEAYDLDAGAGFDALARVAVGDFVLFLSDGATLLPDALATLQHAARASGANLLTYLHRLQNFARESGSALSGVILGSVTEQFFRAELTEMPLFVRRTVFEQLGGFSTDYRVTGHDHEFVARAMMANVQCETVMRELGTVLGRSADSLRKAGYDSTAVNFRAVRPIFAGAPLAVRDLLLHARSMVFRPTPPNRARDTVALPAAPPARPNSRTPVPEAVPQVVPDAAPQAARIPTTIAAMVPVPIAPQPAISDHLAKLLAEHSAVRANTMVGQFLGIYQGRLYGWACNLAAPSESVELALTVQGKTLVYRARQRFPKWSDVPPEAVRNGFIVEIPQEYRRSPTGTHLSLVTTSSVSGVDLVLAEGSAAPPGLKLNRTGIMGTCENDTNGMLTGWACYKDEPDRIVSLAAYVDGLFLGRFRADHAHSKASPGGGGFRFVIPEALRLAGRVQVDVVVEQTGIGLWRSPVRVDGWRVSVSRW